MEGDIKLPIFLTIIMVVILGLVSMSVVNRTIIKSTYYRVEIKFIEELEIEGELSDTLEIELNGLEYEKFKNELKGYSSVFELKGKVYNKNILESYRVLEEKEGVNNGG